VGAIRLGADPSVAPNAEQAPTYRPAAWRLRGGAWQEIPAKPVSFYGERAILRQVACRGDDFAALGGASGGAHGNLRITTWIAQGGAEIVQNPLEDFEMFGGGSAIGVEQMVAFAGGYLMAGNWLHVSGRAGPAVWLSPDGQTWKRLPEDPALASTDTVKRQANGAMVTDGLVYLLGEQRSSGKESMLVATSGDGVTWQRETAVGEGGVLAGAASTIAAWRGAEIVVQDYNKPQWVGGGSFAFGQGTMPPRITGMTSTLIGLCGGSACNLWRRAGAQWKAIGLPAPLAAVPTSLVLIAVSPQRETLLVLTDGNNLRIFDEVRAS
jgi:hypothetical protein